MKNNLTHVLAMPIGMILLAIAIILNRFLPENNVNDFLIGFLFGLSIALNIYYIFISVKRNKSI